MKFDFIHYPDSRISLSVLQDEQEGAEIPEVKAPPADSTGTDPRDFSSKLMPYFLYTKLENEVTIKQMNLFGMHAFDGRFAMTYDIPLAKQIELVSGGGDTIGLGDIGIRFFLRPEQLEWDFEDNNSMGKQKSISLMPLVELTFPTATEDVLGGGSMIVSPGFVIVTDMPGDAPIGLGFFAMMNFFDFDIFKEDSRESTTRWRGRWFWMQPLSKPGPNLFDGLYILTELQPVYDFMTSDFDLWIAPEFGKALPWGAIYAKPGWGMDTEVEDRDFTFEIGFRYFF